MKNTISVLVALFILSNASVVHAGVGDVVRVVVEIIKPETAEAPTHDGKGNVDK